VFHFQFGGAKPTKAPPWRRDWFEPKVFRKQMCCIEESLCDIFGTFRRPRYSAPGVLCPHALHSLRPWVRGVTRWDGARGNKQLWRPHVRTWDLSDANLLYWSTCDILRTFRHPRNDSAPSAVIRRPHSDSAPGELCSRCPPRYAPALGVSQSGVELLLGVISFWKKAAWKNPSPFIC